MNAQLQGLADLDRTIHEPARLMILAVLSGVKECDFLFLARETGMTNGNLSSHLTRLEESRYVEVEKTYRGKVPRTVVHLTRDGRCAFDTYRKALKGALQ
ncbi:MAG: transcriptional regulator [Candidatus Acidiferrales bacterium]